MNSKEFGETSFRVMGINTSKQKLERAKTVRQVKYSLKQLIQDYQNLIALSKPSEVEFQKLVQILELAVYDTELNELIEIADKELAKEMNLLKEEYFHNI